MGAYLFFSLDFSLYRLTVINERHTYIKRHCWSTKDLQNPEDSMPGRRLIENFPEIISLRANLRDRLEEQPNGCWALRSFRGYLLKDRRPQIVSEGITWIGARYIYCQLVEDIPHRSGKKKSGLILHRCSVNWCLNPYHLYRGSHSDNQRDKYSLKPHRDLRTKMKISVSQVGDGSLYIISSKLGINPRNLRRWLSRKGLPLRDNQITRPHIEVYAARAIKDRRYKWSNS